MHYIYVRPKAIATSLICHTERMNKKSNGIKKKLTTKTETLRRNGPVIKAMESVLQAGRESMVGKICEIGRF